MKLPKNYLENLSVSKYREYLKLLPNMKNESNKAITMLIFTFVALSILGIFAINPTLTTIVELNKQLEDSQLVHDKLTTKMNNLSSLQQQYTNLSSDIPLVFDAVPQKPEVALLVGQIQSLAQTHHITLNTIRVDDVLLAANKKVAKPQTSFIFSLEAEGNFDDMITFSTSLSHFNRLVTIKSIGLAKNPKTNALILTVEGEEYFSK